MLSVTRLFTSRLFWKFFAAIMLAQVAATVAIGGAVWWKNRQNATTRVELIDTSPRASDVIEAATATLQHGGEAALVQFLSQMKHHHVYAINQQQKELLGRELSAELLQELTEQVKNNPDGAAIKAVRVGSEGYILFLPQLNGYPSKPLKDLGHMLPRELDHAAPPPKHDLREPMQGQLRHKLDEVFGDEFNNGYGKVQPMRPPREAPLSPSFIIAAAVCASLLFAALMAWMFTRPLMALQQAFDAAAHGDLQARFVKRQHWIDDELNQLGQSFDHMTAQLRATMQQQTKLMHDVSHELRSPLARMQAAIGLIHQQPERTLSYVERIERESTRMDHLIGELLTLARLEAGAIHAKSEVVFLSEIMDNLLDDMRFEAEQQAQSLHYALTQDFRVSAHFDLLVRAIENIIRNAIKYSPAGSKIEIQASYNIDTQFGVLRISDQGPGVPETELDSIFQAFYRSHQAGNAASGHGLGLAIARQIIHHLHGSIKAENRPQGGLMISITLPAQLLTDL